MNEVNIRFNNQQIQLLFAAINRGLLTGEGRPFIAYIEQEIQRNFDEARDAADKATAATPQE